VLDTVLDTVLDAVSLFTINSIEKKRSYCLKI
jgi:hypothetical protein